MADPQTQAPDQQMATGVPAPPEPMNMGGLIDALRSRGTLPSNLAQTMQPLGNGPSVGLAMGSGALNATSGGNAALNPYLQQYQDQMNKQFWQQRELARMQEHEQTRRARQDELGYQISKDLLKSDNPLVAKTGAQGVVNFMDKLGMPKEQQPKDLVEALATKRITDAEMNSMMRDIHLGMTDEQLAVKYQNASPMDIQQARISKDSPLALKTLGLKTPEEQLKQTYDLRIAAAKALEAEHPELRGDANTVGAIQMKARELFQKDFKELSPDEQSRAYKSAIADKDAREEKMLRIKGELDLQKLMQGLQFKAANPTAAKPMLPQAKVKLLQTFQQSVDVNRNIDMVLEAVEGMEKKGLMPTRDDVAAQYTSKLNRQLRHPGSPEVTKWQQLWAPVSIGQIDRTLLDEKGVRAQATFAKQLNAVDNIPTAAAVRSYLGIIKQSILDKTAERVADYEALDGMPPDVLERSKALYLQLGGKGKAASPLNPDKDPLGILR